PLTVIVAAASAYFLAYGVTQPLWGIASDRIGLVRTMRITLLAAGVFSLASAASPGVSWLLVSRTLAGGCFSAAFPAALVYVGDTVPGVRRQHEVTGLLSGSALGTAVATAGAGLLAATIGWRWMFVATGLLGLGLAFALRALPRPPRTRMGRPILAPLRDVLRHRASVLVIGLAFAEGAIIIGVITYLPAAVEDGGVSPAVAGAVVGIYGLAVLVAATAVGRLSARMPPARLIVVGALATAAACALAALSTRPGPVLAVCVLLGIGWAFMHSTLQTWATMVLPSARATVISLFAGALFAGSAVSSALGGSSADQGRWALIFLVALAATVPLGLVAAISRHRWSPVPAEQLRAGQS
ncbi:MAG TPA: MFS transporter, partial [Actinomycetes bacterium]|nr:MFS transporter [Actinomycetes bacterium]